MKLIVIKKNDANQRLDKFLSKSMPNLPSSMIYKSIRKKRVKLNGKRCEASSILHTGDILELYINDEFLVNDNPDLIFLSATRTIDIVYEDENILLVKKQPGLIVHEDENEKIDTLINRIKKYLFDKGEFDYLNELCFTPSLVNRIDRNTGGIVIAAKNAESLRILNQKLKDREIKKLYMCIVHGIPKNKKDILKGYLFKNEKENKVYIYNSPNPQRKIILTKYKVIKSIDNLSMLEIELLTGRTHQIRAHMAHIGHPLLGDTKYGTTRINQEYDTHYQALTSYKIVFQFTSDAGILQYLQNKSFSIPVNFPAFDAKT